jgi:hypothetical protein
MVDILIDRSVKIYQVIFSLSRKNNYFPFKSTNSVLEPSRPICFVIHSNTRFLISSSSPLPSGKVRIGVDIVDLPPHLILALFGGRNLFS